MSGNDVLVICFIKKEKVWAVFHIHCVDNVFKKPISSKHVLFKHKDFDKINKFANKYYIDNPTEYGIEYI